MWLSSKKVLVFKCPRDLSRLVTYKSLSLCAKSLILNGLRNVSLDSAFNIRGHGENTPYSSSELHESGIVNRQSRGEKLKYIFKFYIGVHVT